MADNDKHEHEDQEQNNEEKEPTKNTSDNNSDIIELSDIAIGITPEDDAIVELTEEIIDGAFVGFTGATSEIVTEDEQRLDLSPIRSGLDGSESSRMAESRESDDLDGAEDVTDDNLEEDISRELDDYFGPDEDVIAVSKPTAEEIPAPTVESDLQSPDEKETPEIEGLDDITITRSQIDDAVERVIRKMFAEKINRMLDEVIERTVSEEISQLKDYLLGISVTK